MDTATQTRSGAAQQTMELLWLRVRQRGDLPGFSKVVSAIIGAMRGDDDREFSMTKTVLQDPALTQKVLRLANSAMYSVFGQGINTVSKAVIVLGTEAIGHLALGLKLVDGLSAASAASVHARAEMEKAVLAGHIARQLTCAAATRDAEEAVVCSMLHSLGRMMTTFYLPDKWQEVLAHSAACGCDENESSFTLLGLGLDDIGREAARQWGLPTPLVQSMSDMPPNAQAEALDHQDWLAAVSTLSSRCAEALNHEEGNPEADLARLVEGYAEMLGMDASQVLQAVDAARRTAATEDAVVPRSQRREDVQPEAPAVPGKPKDSVSILARGVVDVRSALSTASSGQLMSMALETIYQGFGFSRSIAFLRDRDRRQYIATMSLGEGVQEKVPRLVFGDGYEPNIFHAALANDKMIFVENARDPRFNNKLPRWWKEALPDVRSFLLLPLTVNRQPVGFLYGDWDQCKPLARVDQREVAPLTALRVLVVRMLEQRRRAEPSWLRRLP
ncbi:MAG TPA: HDOD domain-containing protein [Noviherbaspirillum sp.]|jgi:HD-like signal output (HDOD) protein|uniref:HDOD domain-containing protein n=1 Tax=Noviherbaspirillum sp. TaxID=1926288 RepID=UPI002F951DCB